MIRIKLIKTLGGCPGGTLEVLVQSKEFQGKNTLQKHRMVQALLKEEIATVHAFMLKAELPDE